MYKILDVDDKVRVPPMKFNLPVEEAVKLTIEENYEGVVNKTLGVVLSVQKVEDVKEGRILPEDGSIYYPSKFKLVVYQPEINEIITGEIIDVTEFGVFIRFGPVDGMIHVSQLMNDFVSFDNKNMVFLGKESKRKVKQGDKFRARIISVSMEGNQYKIGLTGRQAGLGNLEWIKEDKKKLAKAKD